MSEAVDKTEAAAVADEKDPIDQEEENDLLSGEEDLNFEAGYKNIVMYHPLSQRLQY